MSPLRLPTLPSRLKTTARRIFGADPRSLALFRIGLASILLIDLGKRALALTAHYTDAGVLPRVAIDRHVVTPIFFSPFHMLGGSTGFQAALFAIAAAVAICLLVGYRSKSAAFLSLLLNVSLQQRNMLILHQADALLSALLLWSLFVPIGARYAIDARRHEPHESDEPIASIGTAGLFLQVTLVYFTTFLFKIENDLWRNGDALWITLNVDTYATAIGQRLLAYPDLLRGITRSALAIEGIGPVLLLSPVANARMRCLGILLLLYLHIGIWMCLSIALFQPLSVVAMIPFLPALFWSGLGRLGSHWSLRSRRSRPA
ncbi:MAG: HTTM domain-containing protein [Acidobacteriota bacterium]